MKLSFMGFALVLFTSLALALQAGDERSDDGFVLERPAPIDEDLPERLPGAERIACAACHVTIAEEWATSLHALAWVDPRYQEAIERKRRKASCTGCHIPAPLHSQTDASGEILVPARPRPRLAEEEKLHYGVSCKTCHLGPDGVLLGPTGIETDAHPTARSERFVAPGVNDLCATCHATTIGPVVGLAKDFQARIQAKGQVRGAATCVDCHMAKVVRPVALDENDNPTPARPGRSHALQTPRDPAFLAQAFEIEVAGSKGELTLGITNRAGHRVPGLEGRRFVFRAEDPDADRRHKKLGSVTLDTRSYLPVGSRREMRLETSGKRIRVLGEHWAPGAREPVLFLDRIFRAPDEEAPPPR